MQPFRRLIPPVSGFDISAIFVFLAISVCRIIVTAVANGLYLNPNLVLGIWLDKVKHYLWQQQTLTLHCHIQPKAAKDEIVGLYNDTLKIRLTSSPVDGKANKHLIAFLSQVFAIPKGQITLLRGQSSRRKTVQIVAPKTLPENSFIEINKSFP